MVAIVVLDRHAKLNEASRRAAVGVGDERPSEPHDPWKARQRPFEELGKLAVITARQIIVNLANLALANVSELVDARLTSPVDSRRQLRLGS
jgi:hypothetical protein